MKIHPWLKHVHATMLAENLSLTCREISARFGEPEGKQSAANRIAVAVSKGWFAGAQGSPWRVYTAVARSRRYFEWSPEYDAKLAEAWPTQGIKCMSLFPGATRLSVTTRLERLNEMRGPEDRIRRIRTDKPAPAVKRVRVAPEARPWSRDGLPIVNSIFSLGAAL